MVEIKVCFCMKTITKKKGKLVNRTCSYNENNPKQARLLQCNAAGLSPDTDHAM